MICIMKFKTPFQKMNLITFIPLHYLEQIHVTLMICQREEVDSIIVASINKNFDIIKLISIHGDTYVEVLEHGRTKINHAYAYERETLAIRTINPNFSLNITDMLRLIFQG